MKLRAIPSFDRLTIAEIYRRNFGRRTLMLAAMVTAAEEAIRRGVDERTKTEWMRESIRHLDRYATQRGLPQ